MLKKLLLLTLLLTFGAVMGTILGLDIKNRVDDDISKVLLALVVTAVGLGLLTALMGIIQLFAKMLHILWTNELFVSVLFTSVLITFPVNANANF